MRELGHVVRLQIQRSSLKTGDEPDRVYDPAPILTVDRLSVSPDGALGEAAPGAWVVDIHHRVHPSAKNPDGEHGISLGFTSHYDAMRARLGDRITPGCAGENILVEARGRVGMEDLTGGVGLVTPDGREVVRLQVLQVAHPCRPVGGWEVGRVVETDVLKEPLQVLDDGTRGFYCVGAGTGFVSVGDRVVLL